jgi:Asp/Glu/hydantoin racemase
MRIWWQSFVDREQNGAYFERLGGYLAEISDPGTEVDVLGLSPPDRGFGRLTELRCAALAVDNALEAAAQGYDAFTFGHFQEPGLYEARSATSIPVVGLGEATLHWAAQLGRHLGLVTIDPVFDRYHLEQADLYGLRDRVRAVVGLGLTVEDFAPAFAGEEGATASLIARLAEVVRPLVDDGVDVVVPAGALPALLLAGEHGLTIGHAPVVSSVAVALKQTEVAVKLRAATGLEPSRGPSFALPPDVALEDFRRFVSRGRDG